MSVQAGQDEQFTFVAGLNTEASYFTFPKNTWKDGDNVIPYISGKIGKRRAVDLESDWALTSRSITTAQRNTWAFTSGKWTAIAGDGDLNFIVSQVGRYVYFYPDTPVSPSLNVKSFTIDLNTYLCSGNTNTIGTAPIKCVSAQGRLLITCRDIDPIIVTYTASTDSISVSAVTIKIRDFEGVNDGLAVDQHPSTLSDSHKYNLLNQGWDSTKWTNYYGFWAYYPSNAQSWVYGKDSLDNFDRELLNKQDFGTSPAPKGRYVLDAFNQDRATVSGITGLAIVKETTRPKVGTFFAGRAFFAGIESTTYGSTVFFSQVAVDATKYGLCHQNADPTAEVLSDLVDSDGGVIPIQDCGEIVDILNMDNGVVVLATNGVWTITGTSNIGFSATGYEVKKVSSLGCAGQQSVVDVEEGILFWGYSGICSIGKDNVGALQISSITDLNIKSLYSGIPSLAKQFASGGYNAADKVVYWLYNRNLDTDDDTFPYQKTNILALDVRLNAFYTLSFSDSQSLPVILDVVVTKETLNQSNTFTVIDASSNNVIDSSSNQVTATIVSNVAGSKQWKFQTLVPSGSNYEITFSDFLNERNAPNKWRDWYNYNSTGVTYSSYLLTGYNFAPNGPSKRKQSQYITVYMERTETGFDASYNDLNSSSCTMQTRWDFTDSANANKWDAGQEVYRHTRMYIPSTTDFDDGYPVVITRNKIRGRGRALQLKFTANEDYDMRILGWSNLLYGSS